MSHLFLSLNIEDGNAWTGGGGCPGGDVDPEGEGGADAAEAPGGDDDRDGDALWTLGGGRVRIEGDRLQLLRGFPTDGSYRPLCRVSTSTAVESLACRLRVCPAPCAQLTQTPCAQLTQTP
eukprot:COSAG01_NODE_35535_length_530_cov_1.614849_2_plen_120_part_01